MLGLFCTFTGMTAENLYQPFEISYKETSECVKPVHRHNFFELVYIVDGTGKHCINRNKFDYSKGHLFLLTPQDSHRYDNKQPYHLEIVQHIVNTLIAIVARNIYIQLPGKMQYASGSGDTILKMVHYIQNNIYRPELLKSERMAAVFSLSINYLSEYFKKHTGENLQQYITYYRLQLVETRLLHSTLRINEIVFELGFTDESHLNRMFKKHRGMSPGEFRRRAVGGLQVVRA